MDSEPVLCQTCNVPMSPRRLLLGRLDVRRGVPADPVRVTSWQCWGCGRVRRAAAAGSTSPADASPAAG